MAIPLEEMLDKLNPEDRAEVDALAQVLIEEKLTLRDLRRARQLTQERMAEFLGIEQDNVSRLERRADMLLSTMSSYVEAMGGRLRLIAEFPGRAPVSLRLMDLGEGAKPQRKQARPASLEADKGKALLAKVGTTKRTKVRRADPSNKANAT